MRVLRVLSVGFYGRSSSPQDLCARLLIIELIILTTLSSAHLFSSASPRTRRTRVRGRAPVETHYSRRPPRSSPADPINTSCVKYIILLIARLTYCSIKVFPSHTSVCVWGGEGGGLTFNETHFPPLLWCEHVLLYVQCNAFQTPCLILRGL